MTQSAARGPSPEKAVPWRLRRDLQWYPADRNSDDWTVRDPVRLTYFRMRREEREFLQLLDGRRSLRTVVQKLSGRFPDVPFAASGLISFLSAAIRSGLLVSTIPGHGTRLALDRRRQQAAAVPRKLLSLISHRFRGPDPQPLLIRLDRAAGWVFHPAVLAGLALFVLTAALVVLSHGARLAAELPQLDSMFTVRNLLQIGLIIAVVKVLHELAHGLTCVHHGRECHELGCVVIGVLPLLYCDVSDSWTLNSRWHRIQIAAAGIAVELFLAAVCGLLWVSSVPGPLHAAFLNIMLVCSLNTVLVNGNPLLRYDGYYVLSDLLNIPNLGPRSRQAAISLFDRYVLGVPLPAAVHGTGLRAAGMPLFGLISGLYRLFVLAAILLIFYRILAPYRLEPIAWLLTASTAAGIAVQMFLALRQRISAVARSAGVSRAVVGLTGFILGIGLILFWPLPGSVRAPFTLTPGTSHPVYVSTPGRLVDSADYGQILKPGDTIARLASPDIELLLARTEAEYREQQVRLQWLRAARGASPESALALPATQAALRSTEERLAALRRRASRLHLSSPAAGTLLPPRTRPPQRDAHHPDVQRFWQETPLAPVNRSAWLEPQTLVGWIGRAEDLRAVVYVRQQDVEFVRADATAVLVFDSHPRQPLFGRVTVLGTQPETQVPWELLADGSVAGHADGRPTQTYFAVQVKPDDADRPVPPLYSTGTASISCPPASLARRAWRFLTHTFGVNL